MKLLARRLMMEKFNEIDPIAEDLPREMGLQRALFLLIASLLYCGAAVCCSA
jgi:hypothetical protein